MLFSKSKIVHDENLLRAASPNERRCIIRESLDFYRALVLGGIYEFTNSRNLGAQSTYAHALEKCIQQHPFLATTIQDAVTETPYFAFCPLIDLDQHIQIRPTVNSDDSLVKIIERQLPSVLDEVWDHSIPPWRIVVFPLSSRKCFIAFAYSHGFSDGMCGMMFHRAFLAALEDGHEKQDLVVYPRRKEISMPFDTPAQLPITWIFLLSPLLGTYLPKTLVSLFGLRGSPSETQERTWTGSSVFSPEEYRTQVRIMSADSSTIEKVLQLCRKNGAKLTGLIHLLIIRALSVNLSDRGGFDTIMSMTAINMREAVGIHQNTMGMFVSGHFELHPVIIAREEDKADISWIDARQITDTLAFKSKDLVDQPVGLLRYLTSVRSWLSSKIGSSRDSSYEVSNVGLFQPLQQTTRCAITDMIFCQPMAVYGPPLAFNIVSVAGGPLHITVNWQAGALDIGHQAVEVDFVERVCESVQRGFVQIAQGYQE